MNKFVFLLGPALLLNLTACTRLSTASSYQVLGDTAAAVQTAFNADTGKVRVLMLVSPTCGACLHGGNVASEQLSTIEHGKDAAVYVVWVPRRGAHEKDVSSATRVITAAWAHQYWDGGDILGEQYKQVLGWRENAWDVYMVYGRGAQWTGELPPMPDFFMQQTSEPGLRLDGRMFGARVEELLRQQ